MPQNLDENTVAEADALIADGQYIMAIKVVREHSGCDLLTAKRWVDQRKAGGGTTLDGGPEASEPSKPAAAMPGVDEQIRRGNLIEAIKLYRDATGQGLRESKDFVDARKKELASSPASAIQVKGAEVLAPPRVEAGESNPAEQKKLDEEQAARFAGPPKKAGCFGILVIVAAGYLIWRWL